MLNAKNPLSYTSHVFGIVYLPHVIDPARPAYICILWKVFATRRCPCPTYLERIAKLLKKTDLWISTRQDDTTGYHEWLPFRANSLIHALFVEVLMLSTKSVTAAVSGW